MLLRRWEIDCGRLNKSWSVASDKSYMVAGTNPHLPLIRTNIERPATTFSLRIQTKQAIDYKYRSCEVFSSPLFASCERDLWGKKRGLKSKPTSHLWRKTHFSVYTRERGGCQPAWVGFGWSWCSREWNVILNLKQNTGLKFVDMHEVNTNITYDTIILYCKSAFLHFFPNRMSGH